MDNSDVYASADSGKVISPEWECLEALKKVISKHGMPKGIYLDTGEEFIRVFGEGEGLCEDTVSPGAAGAA